MATDDEEMPPLETPTEVAEEEEEDEETEVSNKRRKHRETIITMI